MLDTIPNRSVTLLAAELNDVDGIKVALTTVAAPQVYTGAALDGAVIDTASGRLDLARTATVSSDASAGAFALDDIVFTGTRKGAIVTDTLTLTQINGNETIFGTQAFDTITQIDVAAMADTDGELSFGVGDICAPDSDDFKAVKLHAAANLFVQFDEGAGTRSDTIPMLDKIVEQLRFNRVLTGAAETATGLTVYL